MAFLYTAPLTDNAEFAMITACFLGGETMKKDALMIAVSHSVFRELNVEVLSNYYNPKYETKVIADIKGLYDKNRFVRTEWDYWRL